MKFFKILVLVVLLLVMVAAGGLAWMLFTQGGRDWLVAQVNGYTATLETPVLLGKLEGDVLGDVRLSSLTVADAYGVWLSLEGIRLVWTPRALLDGTRPFERFEVSRTLVTRMPVAASTTTVPEKTDGGNVLDYLVYVPKELALDDVTVEAPVTGKRHRLRADMASMGKVQNISVTTLEGPVTAVSGSVVVSSRDQVAVDLSLREAAGGLIGGLLKLQGNAGVSAVVEAALRGERVTVNMADFRAGSSRLQVSGEGAVSGGDVSGTALVTSADLSEWQGLVLGLGGKISGRVDVSGTRARMAVGVAVSGSDIRVSDTRVSGLAMVLDGVVDTLAEGTPFTASGDVKGTLSGVADGSYPLHVMLDASGTTAALDGSATVAMARRGETALVKVVGSGVVSPMVVQGTLDGNWQKGTTRLTAAGTVDADPVRAMLSGFRITGPGTSVSASGNVTYAGLLVDGTASVKIDDLAALGRLAGVKVSGGMDAQVVAAVRNGVQTADANVRRFEVAYDRFRALLRKPSRLVWDGTAGNLSPFELEIAGGTVTAQGRMSEALVNGTLVVSGVDMTELMDSDAVEGKLDLNAKVAGTPRAPVMTATVRFDGATGKYPLDIKADGDWRSGRLAVKADIRSENATAKADVVLGGGLGLMPFEIGITEASSLRGTVTADADLAMLNPTLWASRQQVGGRLSGQATLGGTLGEPLANGRFALTGGSYAQSTSGVCLKDVTAEIIASRDQVAVQNLVSRDGQGGTLEGQATLGLTGAKPMNGHVALRNLQLFCGGVALGNVDGGLGVSGVLTDHTVRGKVSVTSLQVQLPGSNPDVDIPQVPYERVRSEVEVAGRPIITRLDVTVDAPQKVFVRGRGMDAEFGGSLAVTGTANAPVLTGTLTALRGRYTLLDRVLQLADSSVRFEGPIPPSPYLAVKATTRAQSTDITVNITGSASKPQLSLTSEPPRPQDEVLALLLFGRELANISAFEALRLAQATRVLAGRDGGGPGILDRARQTLGVDTLDIGSSGDSGDVTVTTGKYIGDKVFVSVEQGTEPEDREFKTEIELLPRVTGNTTVDGAGNQSIGIEWKRDY